MSDTPEGGFTLDWIGRAMLGLQQGMRGLSDRLAGVETEQRELRERFDVFETQVSAALFRADANWRDTRQDIGELRREVTDLRVDVRGLRTACEGVLHHLRADQSH